MVDDFRTIPARDDDDIYDSDEEIDLVRRYLDHEAVEAPSDKDSDEEDSDEEDDGESGDSGE